MTNVRSRYALSRAALLLTGALWVCAGAADVRPRLPKPTRNGDMIGTATMDERRAISMRLRSVECDGAVVEGVVIKRATDQGYAETLASIGAIKAGETKPVVARNILPCPRRARR